jgi:hypothetical protein
MKRTNNESSFQHPGRGIVAFVPISNPWPACIPAHRPNGPEELWMPALSKLHLGAWTSKLSRARIPVCVCVCVCVCVNLSSRPSIRTSYLCRLVSGVRSRTPPSCQTLGRLQHCGTTENVLVWVVCQKPKTAIVSCQYVTSYSAQTLQLPTSSCHH